MRRLTEQTLKLIQERIYRATLLAALAFGGASPIFLADELAKGIGLVCVLVLTALASYKVFRIGAQG